MLVEPKSRSDRKPRLSASALPLFPASWYLLDAARNIGPGPATRRLLGQDLVAFRGAGGRVAVMDARCSHFGADLGRGRVVGDSVQCPYHGWKYGTDGRCASIPSGCAIPGSARQTVYPVEERHGFVFFFNGPVPAFPLPWFLDDAPPEGFAASRSFEFTAESPWPSVTGHAFDLQHFLYIHDRRLVEPPVIDVPAPFVRRIRYRAEIVPENWRDRSLCAFGGRTVSASLVVWGGTFSVITARFGRFISRFLIVSRPLDRGRTLCQGIVFAPKAAALTLPIRRFFTSAYLMDENAALSGTASVPSRFVDADAPLRDYFEFLAGMPKTEGDLI